VLVEEKVDGSQFSFGLDTEGLRIRSKGAEMIPDAPEKMFAKCVDKVKTLPLHPGWTYRGECLAKPKHNVLAYERVPAGHVILFDINDGHESYLSWEDKKTEADRLGLEVVPRLFEGSLTELAAFRPFLETKSVLGGQLVEGVVVKNYQRFGIDKKALMGKFVSEVFKEVHAATWKSENPKSGDIIDNLIRAYHSQARWMKGVQHLREAGKIEDSPRDIGALFREIPEDIKRECETEIKEALFAWAWPNISRGAMAGFPQWYKEQLLVRQFTPETTSPPSAPSLPPPSS
jgi:hypothetical protein